MDERHSVELQAEVHAARDDVWPLLSTADGFGRWLDGAEFPSDVGGRIRLHMRDAVAVGSLLALDRPQHVSFTFDWDGDPIGQPTVVALDAIDHGESTHLTLRHVGLPGGRQRGLHEALWRHWFERLVLAAGQSRAGYREAARRS